MDEWYCTGVGGTVIGNGRIVMIVCKNCSSELFGKYCAKCGQKAIEGRLNLKDAALDSLGLFFNVERGFLFTLKELLLRRGIVIREFIEGKRKKYYGPFKFALLLSTIGYLFSAFLDRFQENEISASKEIKSLDLLVEQNPAIAGLFFIPFFSLVSRFVFRKQGFNYSEHLVLNAYYIGILSFLGLFFDLGKYFWGSTFPTFLIFLFLIIPGVWLYMSFFKGNRIKLGFASLLSLFLGILFFGITMVSINKILEVL